MADRPLAAALLAAADWFNDALLDRLEAAGWPRLSRNQSQVFPLLARDGTTQSEVARRLGITRQSAHALLHGLEHEGLLTQVPDPDDRRAVRVRLTPRGRRLAEDAARFLAELEAELVDRIGARQVAALRRAVSLDWGPPPGGVAATPGPARPSRTPRGP